MPFSSLNSRSFYLSADGEFVLLDAAPTSEKVDAKVLGQLFDLSPWSAWKTSDQALHDAAVGFKQAQSTGSSSVHIIARRLDGDAKVVVDRERMSAVAKVSAPWGGQAVTVKRLHQVLRLSGVCAGYDEEAIRQLLETAASAVPGSLHSATVARGRLPEHGQDSRFERLVPTLAERVLRPQSADDERAPVDLRELGAFFTVSVGDALMRCHPPTPGIPGFRVSGESLPAKDGLRLTLHPGEGTCISPVDESCLIASREGLPQDKGNGMTVDEVLVIHEVNARYGHVTFAGSLAIRGNVCDGMRVKAEGSICVAGVVESASLEAGVDVVVDKGIVGHPEKQKAGNSCRVSAGGKVVARFAQYASIEAGGDVLLASQLLHTEVRTPGCVLVADEKRRKGTLLGGRIMAGEQIVAVNMGGVADNTTRLAIMGNHAGREAQRELIHARLSVTNRLDMQLQEVEARLLKMKDMKQRQCLTNRMVEAQQRLQEEQSRLRETLNQLDQEEAQFLARARVVCCRQLYAGVHVHIDGKQKRIEKDYAQCQIRAHQGELVIDPLSRLP